MNGPIMLSISDSNVMQKEKAEQIAIICSLGDKSTLAKFKSHLNFQIAGVGLQIFFLNFETQ